MSAPADRAYFADGVRLFAMEAALQAFIDGDAVVSNDGMTIRWPEPDCSPKVDRLVGISRCEGQWVPLIEAAA